MSRIFIWAFGSVFVVVAVVSCMSIQVIFVILHIEIDVNFGFVNRLDLPPFMVKLLSSSIQIWEGINGWSPGSN